MTHAPACDWHTDQYDWECTCKEAPMEAEDAWQAMDAWCRRAAETLSRDCEQHILIGGDLNAPAYRVKLGQHVALMRMRSFIHGAKQAVHK